MPKVFLLMGADMHEAAFVIFYFELLVLPMKNKQGAAVCDEHNEQRLVFRFQMCR
jgi:hypothetical protein